MPNPRCPVCDLGRLDAESIAAHNQASAEIGERSYPKPAPKTRTPARTEVRTGERGPGR